MSVDTAILVGPGETSLNRLKHMQINAVTDLGKQLVSVCNVLPQVGRSVGRLLDMFHTSLNQMYRCKNPASNKDAT